MRTPRKSPFIKYNPTFFSQSPSHQSAFLELAEASIERQLVWGSKTLKALQQLESSFSPCDGYNDNLVICRVSNLIARGTALPLTNWAVEIFSVLTTLPDNLGSAFQGQS